MHSTVFRFALTNPSHSQIPFHSCQFQSLSVSCQSPDPFFLSVPMSLLSDPVSPPVSSRLPFCQIAPPLLSDHVSPSVRLHLPSCQIPSPLLSDCTSPPVRSCLPFCQIASPLLSDPVSYSVRLHLPSCQIPSSLLSDCISPPVRSRLLFCQIAPPLLSTPLSLLSDLVPLLAIPAAFLLQIPSLYPVRSRLSLFPPLTLFCQISSPSCHIPFFLLSDSSIIAGVDHSNGPRVIKSH
jgi:hypothetical protein